MTDRQDTGGYRYSGDERQRWTCPDCGHEVLVLTSDPYYPDNLVCLECDEEMEGEYGV